MYLKLRNFSLVGIAIFLIFAALQLNFLDYEETPEFAMVGVIFILAIFLSYAFALIEFFSKKKYKNIEKLDILFLTPPVLYVIAYILAVGFGIDVTKSF